MLAEDSAAEPIFASQNLESAAVAQFGKPLPGRRYALERSLTEAPRVIVARVLEDAPVAMGPIVYLRAGTCSVSTVICRCMAAQVKRLAATSPYQLQFCQAGSADSAPGSAQVTGWEPHRLLAGPRACRQPPRAPFPAAGRVSSYSTAPRIGENDGRGDRVGGGGGH